MKKNTRLLIITIIRLIDPRPTPIRKTNNLIRPSIFILFLGLSIIYNIPVGPLYQLKVIKSLLIIVYPLSAFSFGYWLRDRYIKRDSESLQMTILFGIFTITAFALLRSNFHNYNMLPSIIFLTVGFSIGVSLHWLAKKIHLIN
jgi:hypothetical protein